MKGHSKFKLFIEDFSDGIFPLNRVKDFINAEGIAPKSIGIEFLDANSKVVISVGHTITTDPKPAHDLDLVHLGKIDENDLPAFEEVMHQAALQFTGIICHEFIVGKEGDVYTLFLTEAED